MSFCIVILYFIFSILVRLQVLMELLATSVHKATELTTLATATSVHKATELTTLATRWTQELKRYLWMMDEGGGS